MTTEYLLHEEVERVLGVLTPVNRLVCRTMLCTGLRIGDCIALRKEQLKRQFYIREEKTGKSRRVNLSDELIEELQSTPGEWVFPGRSPEKHVCRQAVWKDLKRAVRAYRYDQNVGTHSLRKVYAVQLLEKYGDISRVRRALNHSSDAVTIIYALADKRLEARRKRRRTRSKKDCLPS